MAAMERATKSIRWFAPAMERITGDPDPSPDTREAILDRACQGAGISEYWRKNTSHLEGSELANVLRALHKVAGHIGPNVGRIEWAGMSQNGNGCIVLDPGMVTGQYPVPSSKFDYLVGLVVHESMHRTEWSDLVWKKVEKMCRGMPILEKIILHKIVYAGEDIYVDYVSEKSALGKYTQVSRRVSMELGRCASDTSSVTVDDLMLLWHGSAFGVNGSSPSEPYERPLAFLKDAAAKLRGLSLSTRGVTRRCEFRSRLYHATWEKIRGLIGPWKIVDKTLLWYPADSGSEDTRKMSGQSKMAKSSQALHPELARNIEERLAVNSSDITPIIRNAVRNDNEEVVPTSRWDFNIPAHPVVDRKLVSRLRAVFQQYAERRTVLNRGLDHGRVDRRRLYRGPISGHCFFEKQRVANMDWNVCLLVDASGSMSGPKWRLVEGAMGTMHKAFRGFRNRLKAYAYFEVEGICMISRLINGQKVLSIPPSGQTASGQAIIAAGYYMPRDTRKRFLIHITDGESNLGCSVKCGMDYCASREINLVTLGVAYKDREAMEKQYGKGIQFLDHFGQLPAALETLLRWTLLYGGKKVPELRLKRNDNGCLTAG